LGEIIYMHKIIFLILCLAMSSLFSQISYGENAVTQLESQINHLHLSSPPKRILSLCGPGTEILATLNFPPVGYAVLNSGKIPAYLDPFLKNITKVGNVANPSLERIKILKPDVILIDRVYENQSDYIANLKKIAPVLDVRSSDFQDTLGHLHIFAKMLGKEKEEKVYLKNLQAATQRVESLKSQDKILGIFVSSKAIWGWTDKSYLASVLDIANVSYIKTGNGSQYYSDMLQLSVDKILKINPDAIFIFDEAGKNSLPFLQESSAWKYIKAVKNGKIYKFDRDIWSRSKGPLAAIVMLDNLSAANFGTSPIKGEK